MAPTRARFVTALTALAALAAIAAAPASSAGPGPSKAEICGILPGEGAYSYIKVWNIGCARGRKVAGNAYDRFCEPPERCATDVGEIVKGSVRFNGWTCKVKLGYEFSRQQCAKPGKRLTQESAA